MTSHDFDDLMRVPWREMHCGQLAYRVLTEFYDVDVRESDLWMANKDIGIEALERLVDRYLQTQGHRWRLVDDVREGDVVLSAGSQEFGRHHLSVVISTVPFPKVITTSRKAGYPFIQHLSRTPQVLGIYRFVGEPA